MMLCLTALLTDKEEQTVDFRLPSLTHRLCLAFLGILPLRRGICLVWIHFVESERIKSRFYLGCLT